MYNTTIKAGAVMSVRCSLVDIDFENGNYSIMFDHKSFVVCKVIAKFNTHRL